MAIPWLCVEATHAAMNTSVIWLAAEMEKLMFLAVHSWLYY